MQGNKSVIRLKSGGPPLEVNTTQKTTNSKNGVFSVEKFITYSVGKRLLSLNITQTGYAGRVKIVSFDLSEQSGKGGSANLNLRFVKNDRYGILCNTKTKFAGSYDSFKENYLVPPLADTELVCYFCRGTGSGGCFTLEKMRGKQNYVAVERVKATHAFVIDDELNFNVKIKIMNVRDTGLSVEVEGPMKLTMDYTKQCISRIRGKMESEMEANALSLFRNGVCQVPDKVVDQIEGDEGQYESDH
ncbi:hypothetical protein RJT34_14614 [Clitoria ternatea]|uniref:Uncharacterized protein n=1 Tax=Clitoria ternatea TaxID=43366 RepID=A0AAN9JSU0_CLITE